MGGVGLALMDGWFAGAGSEGGGGGCITGKGVKLLEDGFWGSRKPCCALTALGLEG